MKLVDPKDIVLKDTYKDIEFWIIKNDAGQFQFYVPSIREDSGWYDSLEQMEPQLKQLLDIQSYEWH